jgi:two-component system chemotaxis response regulator CheY
VLSSPDLAGALVAPVSDIMTTLLSDDGSKMLPSTPTRILIVDDNSVMRRLLRGLLRVDEALLVVGEASDGEQAIAMAQQLMPDVICLDIEMPKIGGLDVLEKLQELVPSASVLMVSAHTDRQTVETAIARGAAGFIVKPYSARRVLEAISASMAKRSRTVRT